MNIYQLIGHSWDFPGLTSFTFSGSYSGYASDIYSEVG